MKKEDELVDDIIICQRLLENLKEGGFKNNYFLNETEKSVNSSAVKRTRLLMTELLKKY